MANNIVVAIVAIIAIVVILWYLRKPVVLKKPVVVIPPEESILILEKEIRRINDEQVYVISRLRTAIKTNNAKLATDAVDVYNQLSYQESLVRNKIYNYQLVQISDTIKTLSKMTPGVTETEEQRNEYITQINDLIETFNNYAKFVPVIGTQRESFSDDDINKIIMQTEAAIKQNDINTSILNNNVIDLTKTFNDKIASIITQNQTLATADAMSKAQLDIIRSHITELQSKQKNTDNLHKVIQKSINDANVNIDYVKEDIQLQVIGLSSRVNNVLSEASIIVDTKVAELNTELTKQIASLTTSLNALTKRVTTAETSINKTYNYCKANIDNLFLDNHTSSSIGTIVATVATADQINSYNKAAGRVIWLLCNGQSCAGSRYATLTKNTTVPDLRGVFLRGFNDTAANNKILPIDGKQTQYNPEKTGLGSVQPWSMVRIAGEFGPISESLAASGSDVLNKLLENKFIYKQDKNMPAKATPLHTDISDAGVLAYDTFRTFPINTNFHEIRPTNIAVNYIIKVDTVASVAY